VAVGTGQAETISDPSFELNTSQPVPPNFSEAYGRRARIAVQFYKLEEDALDYPQGLTVDRQMRDAMEELRVQYPTIEFFSYDISNPGSAAGRGSCRRGSTARSPRSWRSGSRPSSRCSRRRPMGST
jgi:hypothetical protein